MLPVQYKDPLHEEDATGRRQDVHALLEQGYEARQVELGRGDAAIERRRCPWDPWVHEGRVVQRFRGHRQRMHSGISRQLLVVKVGRALGDNVLDKSVEQLGTILDAQLDVYERASKICLK